MANWINIATTHEIPNGERKFLEIQGIPIVIVNLDGNYYAIEDNCPHQHLPLGDGLIENGNIVCPYHGAMFCIRTGKVQAPPATQDLTTYPIRVQNDTIQININL